MPFHPGILLSSLVLVTCLGMNMALYPEVRQMLGGSNDTAVPAAAPGTDGLMENRGAYPSLDRQKKHVVPEKAEKKATTMTKPSNVVKPIPAPEKPPKEPAKEEAKPAVEPERKSEPETKKNEPPPPKEEPKKEEPKKGEQKPEEKKPEPTEKKPVVPPPKPAEEPKPTETKKESEAEHSKNEPPPVIPVETKAAPKPKPVEKEGASAFRPIVPPELEQEYREAEGKRINQAELPPPRTLPLLKRETLIPGQATPVYANPYRTEAPAVAAPPKEVPAVKPPAVESPKTESPATMKKLPPVEAKPASKVRKPPTDVWDTVDTIMERPILYE